MVTSETRLRPPHNPVDRRAVGWWTANTLLAVGVPVLALVVLGVLIAPARFWLLAPAGLIAVVGLPLALALPRWWFRVHRWEVTDEAVYTRTGFFWQEWRVAPLSRIQTVDVTRGVVQQLFGLASVAGLTASSQGTVRIPHLDAEGAARVADDLARRAERVRDEAT